MTARILAICNQKGGVGKSTTAFHLARAAILRNERVLLVDLDPQGNLTSSTASDPVAPDQAGLADALSSRAPESIDDVIVDGIWAGLEVVPTSGATLGVVRDELVIAGAGREMRLRESLQPLRDRYDLILIDCAPSLDQLTINGLVAADGAVVVTQSKQWSTDGLVQLLTTIGGVRDYYNPELRIAGVLVNQHEERTVSARNWAAELSDAADRLGLPLLTPPIPKRVVIQDAVESMQGLDQWGGADAMEAVELYSKHLRSIEKAVA